MNGLDLFSGIGGMSIALRPWVTTRAYCEIEPFCQSVLLSRMSTNDLENAPIWDDVCNFPYADIPRGYIDIISGGFPCQGISVAGHGKGLEDKRSGLFYEIIRGCREIRPKFIFLENVPAITTRGGIQVINEITALGYDCRWITISAASVGASHRRERWFLLAHAKHDGASTSKERRSFTEITSPRDEYEQKESFRQAERTSELSGDVANPSSEGLEGYRPRTKCTKTQESMFTCESTDVCRPYGNKQEWKKAVYEMGKLSDGVPHQVARLRALGNSVVAAQAREAFKILMGIK